MPVGLECLLHEPPKQPPDLALNEALDQLQVYDRMWLVAPNVICYYYFDGETVSDVMAAVLTREPDLDVLDVGAFGLILGVVYGVLIGIVAQVAEVVLYGERPPARAKGE